ncbi:MAG: phytoene/squalene synthase family protein [Pseudomonadota bacterium]
MAPDPALPSFVAELRAHDRDRYLTCLFAPAECRLDLFALLAFNLEVARTAEAVSEPMIGQIRLQWWRESLEGIYAGSPRRHEVVEALGQAIARHDLPRTPFERLIDGRENDLDPAPPADLAALETYGQATSAGLLDLALEVLACRDDASGEAARSIGVAWALTGLLRAVPFHARAKRLYLPRDLCDGAGLATGDLFELRSSPALCEVVAQVAGRAEVLLAQAPDGLPRTACPVWGLKVLARHYLRVLAAAGHDPFDARVRAPANVWRLARARWFSLRPF